MEIRRIIILFKGIFLDKIEVVNVTKDLIISQFDVLDSINYKISFSDGNDLSTLTINFKESYLLKEFVASPYINVKLSPVSLKILLYFDVLNFVSDNPFVDNGINVIHSISYASIISDRMISVLNSLLKSLRNEKNYLVGYYLLRDMIENIKLYLFFIKGGKEEKANTKQDMRKITEEIEFKIWLKIKANLEHGDKTWDLNINKILKQNESLKTWEETFRYLEEINKKCNSYIHKNGLRKLLPSMIDYIGDIKVEDVFYVVKMFITLIICYDEMILNGDHLSHCFDLGIVPPEGSQYWIGSIFQEFIDNEYDENEKQKLMQFCHMNIKWS